VPIPTQFTAHLYRYCKGTLDISISRSVFRAPFDLGITTYDVGGTIQDHKRRRRKSEGISFSSRCIEQFNLLPVPEERDRSEELLNEINYKEAWEMYLHY